MPPKDPAPGPETCGPGAINRPDDPGPHTHTKHRMDQQMRGRHRKPGLLAYLGAALGAAGLWVAVIALAASWHHPAPPYGAAYCNAYLGTSGIWANGPAIGPPCPQGQVP